MKILQKIILISSFFVPIYGYHENWFDGAASNEDVITLLKMGVPVDLRDYQGYTGLIKAALDGNSDRVKIFLNAGANIHARDYMNNTALILATYSGEYSNYTGNYNNIGVIEYLIENWANPRDKNSLGQAAIRYALFVDDVNQRRDICVLLMKFGADINVQDAQGYTIFHLSMEKKDTAWLVIMNDLFYPLINYGLRNNVGDTAYSIGVKLGFTDEVTLVNPMYKQWHIDRLLAKKPLDYNNFGIYPIHIAAMANNPDILQKMLAQNAPINAKMQDRYGHTPLDSAVLHASLISIKILLDNNANRLEKDNGGHLPLHLMVNMPVQQKRFHVADLLLEKDQSEQLNAQNNKGNTPIHMAVIKHDVDLLHYFLRYKKFINPVLRNNDRKTFADLAKESGNERVITAVNALTQGTPEG